MLLNMAHPYVVFRADNSMSTSLHYFLESFITVISGLVPIRAGNMVSPSPMLTYRCWSSLV